MCKRTGSLFPRNGTFHLRYVIDGFVGQVSLHTKIRLVAEKSQERFMRDRQGSLEQYRAFLKAELKRIENHLPDATEKVIKKPVGPVESFLPVTFEQTTRLLQEAKRHKNPEVYGLFLIMAYTGLRLVDAATLKIDEIDIDRGVIVRIPMKTRRHVKNRHTGRALIGIHPVLRHELARFTNFTETGYVLPEIAQWSAERRSDNVQAVFKKAGIVKVVERESGRKQSLYGSSSLRHSLEDAMRMADVPQVVINATLCHKDGAMASTYATVKASEVIEAIEKALPDLRK